jgi:molybdenum cofactor biosynthesis protein B
MSVQDHKQEAPAIVRCMILTVSDTRTYETDKSGALIKKYLEEAGHCVTEYQVVKDEYSLIQQGLKVISSRADIDAVLINGGTGIALRDTTYEAVRDCVDKEMPGFGEIFRYLSFAEDIGSAAILSRAIAGVRDGKAIFAMPGSTGAVKLAMERIIIPELGHVIREILKDRK